MPTEEQDRLTQFVDARNRVAHQVQRNLDAFQIAMSIRWKLYLQLVSVALRLVLTAAAATALAPPQAAGWAGSSPSAS